SLWRWPPERGRRWLLPPSGPEPGATNARPLRSARPHARVRLCVLLGDAEFRSGPGKLDRFAGGVCRPQAVKTCGTRARPNGAAGRRGCRRSAYEAPRAAADRATRLGGAESKRRRRPRLPAPPSRVTLLVQLVLAPPVHVVPER